MATLRVANRVGSFAEDKDAARDIRLNWIEPKLRAGEAVTLDFAGVDAATQSFAHALLSAAIQSPDLDLLDSVRFENCSAAVRAVIEIVAAYSQDSIDEADP
jgi:hypothetical protein